MVLYQGSNNAVQRDYIGTNVLGQSLPNKADGVFIFDSSGNSVGGVDPANHSMRNFIGANQLSGVEILGNAPTTGVSLADTEANNNLIADNVIGANPSRTADLGNALNGVRISSAQSSASVTGNQVVQNFIFGSGGDGVALIQGQGNAIDGNQIYSSGGDGVSLTQGRGNTVTGGAIDANGVDGVALVNAQGNLVAGGTIAGNKHDGVNVFGAASTGNMISGSTIQYSGLDGVEVQQSAGGNVIGANPNLIDSSGNAGVEVDTGATGNLIQNNQIGLLGTAASTNTYGVLLNTVVSNVVGGNTLSGNKTSGVEVDLGSGNVVTGNFVGVDAKGLAFTPGSVPIQQYGVDLRNTYNNQIRGNVLSGNQVAGVQIAGQANQAGQAATAAAQNFVVGNVIGVDVTGEAGDPQPRYTTFAAATAAPTYESFDPENPGAGASSAVADNRQDNGVLINNSGATTTPVALQGNYVLNNRILANQTGVLVEGALSVGEAIAGNTIGAVVGAPSKNPPTQPLGNFFGVDITGASGDVVQGNAINGNISAGVVLEHGTQKVNVLGNDISRNGGAGTVAVDARGTPIGGGNFVHLGTLATSPPEYIFGAGVYVDNSTNNTIGFGAVAPADGVPPATADGNTIDSSTLAGVYLHAKASGNTVEGNRIVGKNDASGHSEYGIFLFDSAANLDLVAQSGADQNAVSGSYIAALREFTGNVPASGQTVQNYDLPTPVSPALVVAAATPASPGSLFARRRAGG